MKKFLTVLAPIVVIISAFMSAGYHSQTFSEMQCLRNDIARMGIAEVVTEQAAEEPEETQEQVSVEAPQSTEAEVVQEQATQTATKLQVSAIHCENRISVKLVEGNLSEDCINNPTDLESPTGVHRDLYLLFVGEKIQKVSWIYGASQERTCELSPTTGDDGISYLYFNMEEGNGIYLFEVVTETGKVYSFSVMYYDANVI